MRVRVCARVCVWVVYLMYISVDPNLTRMEKKGHHNMESRCVPRKQSRSVIVFHT